MTPNTLDDLTGDEYATLAHKIQGDPLHAIVDPSSTRYAQAHAGLLWTVLLRADPAARYTDIMALPMVEIKRQLGYLPPAVSADDDVDQAVTAPTVVESAQDAVDDLAGEVGTVDPSAPTDWHSSP